MSYETTPTPDPEKDQQREERGGPVLLRVVARDLVAGLRAGYKQSSSEDQDAAEAPDAAQWAMGNDVGPGERHKLDVGALRKLHTDKRHTSIPGCVLPEPTLSQMAKTLYEEAAQSSDALVDRQDEPPQ